MKSPFEHYLTLGRRLFGGTVVVCLLMSAQGLRANHGLSYYGTPGPFLIPYAAGLIAVASVTWRAGRVVPAAPRRAKLIRFAFQLFALLIVGLLLTPDYVNAWFNAAHVMVSAALFGGEFLLAAWLALIEDRTWLNMCLFGLLFAAGLVAFASEENLLRYLMASEVAFQTIFFVILTRSAAASIPGVDNQTATGQASLPSLSPTIYNTDNSERP